MTPNEVNKIKNESQKYYHQHHIENFGGKYTKRNNSVLSKTRSFDKLLLNKRINNILDYYLFPNHLLSIIQLIEISPNETPQPLHIDSGSLIYASSRPRKHPLRLSCIWAINDFTENNGSTVIIPKSHKWPQGRMPNVDQDNLVKAVMQKDVFDILVRYFMVEERINHVDQDLLLLHNMFNLG